MRWVFVAASTMTVLASGGTAVLPGSAHAAPFCLSNQSVPPQCIYTDPASCERESARQGGVCVANPAEVHLSSGVGQYCLVTATQASFCVYSDRSTCANDALRQGGACVYAPGVAPSRAPDPYASVGGR